MAFVKINNDQTKNTMEEIIKTPSLTNRQVHFFPELGSLIENSLFFKFFPFFQNGSLP